jgi:hypothetical protein
VTRLQLIAAAASAVVLAGGGAVALVALSSGDDGGETATFARTASTPRPPPIRATRAPAGCINLRLSAAERSKLERDVFEADAVRGSVYFGACNGRFWSMARFAGGGDGVYRAVRSAHPVRLGSVGAARCDVPDALLVLWRQDGACTRRPVARRPRRVTGEPPRVVREPRAGSRAERCKVPEVKVPNYDPTDGIPDQRLPRPEELLPPRDTCPEAYAGIRKGDDPPAGDSRRRYPNGRTYIEQINWCNVMRQQGVYCVVPPPP